VPGATHDESPASVAGFGRPDSICK